MCACAAHAFRCLGGVTLFPSTGCAAACEHFTKGHNVVAPHMFVQYTYACVWEVLCVGTPLLHSDTRTPFRLLHVAPCLMRHRCHPPVTFAVVGIATKLSSGGVRQNVLDAGV